MPVVINDFEVVPAPNEKDGKAAAQKKDEKGKGDQPMTAHEVGKMLEKRVERLERISAH